MAKFAVILPAAGKSNRFRDREKKPFANMDGRAVWLRSAELFVTRSDVSQCLIIVAKEDQETFRRRYGANMAFMNIQIADGGAERHDSVANALAMVKPEADFVAIHDGVRPCLTDEMINAVFARAEKDGAALLAIPVTDTMKEVDPQHKVKSTLSRQGLWLAQTPQVFRREWITEAYAKRQQLGKDITDDAASGSCRRRIDAKYQDHDESGYHPGGGDPQSPTQAQTHRPGPSVRRRGNVGRTRDQMIEQP